MSNVIEFVSRSERTAAERVADFIELSRTKLVNVLVPNADWSQNVWNVTNEFISKGRNTLSRSLVFYNHDMEINNQSIITAGEPLHDDFIDFAKAYIRYQHATNEVVYENTNKRLIGLRFIEAAFRSENLAPKIENLRVPVLNRARDFAKEGVAEARYYQFAVTIQQIYKLCYDKKLLATPFQWKHGVKKPSDLDKTIGEEAKRKREEKLPSPEAFHGLAHVFRNPQTYSDQILTAVCAICCAVPIRAHEVLQLRIDCEVEEETTVKRIDDDGTEIEEKGTTYGIRVWPGKKNPPQVKWVASVMVSVVKEAVQRLREVCEPARRMAAWYERKSRKTVASAAP